jgi:hypothetical protein
MENKAKPGAAGGHFPLAQFSRGGFRRAANLREVEKLFVALRKMPKIVFSRYRMEITSPVLMDFTWICWRGDRGDDVVGRWTNQQRRAGSQSPKVTLLMGRAIREERVVPTLMRAWERWWVSSPGRIIGACNIGGGWDD